MKKTLSLEEVVGRSTGICCTELVRSKQKLKDETYCLWPHGMFVLEPCFSSSVVDVRDVMGGFLC